MGAVCLVPCLRAEARDAGDVVVAANIGVPLYTHNFDTGKDTTIHDRLSISELLGAHYFVTKAVRVGMMVQWTEQYTGALARGSDRFSTFALLPQVGWNFYDHFSVAAIFTYAPRASGQNRMDLGVQALFGYGLPITKSATLNLIAEVPYNFHLARTIGVSPLAGLTMDL
ncbi:MAG: hypothetical protein FWD17_03735 [Polyangiaceae bacterium]|nr:hypothetical protein [Polyangiaceae bacterium]